jgi:hypothetical protein
MHNAYVIKSGRRAKMAKRILWIAVIVVVAGFLYFGYTTYDAGRAASNGSVYSNDPPSGKRKSDTSPADSREDKTPNQTIVYPTPNPASTVVVPNNQIAQPGTAGGGIPPSTAPANDTLSPNAPNGMRFTGSGRYLLYRQGDITYRLDTDTGFSCVLFATDEQWKKPKVYRDGCNKK